MRTSIVVPIFNDEYKVIVCFGDEKVVRRVLKDWGHDKNQVDQADLDKRRGSCFYAENCHPVIAMPRYPKTAEEIGTLAHEAFHAVDNIFDKIQDYKGHEVFAHSVGAIVRHVLSLKERKK